MRGIINFDFFFSSFIFKKMDTATLDKEKERGGSFVKTSTRFSANFIINVRFDKEFCKYAEDSTPLLKISCGCPCSRLHREPLQKHAKAETRCFCVHTIKIYCWTLQERVLAASRGTLWAEQGCWTQLIRHIRSLPGNFAFLWWFPSCTFAILQHLHLVLLCCHLCSGERREFVFQGEKMYTVLSVRHWAINFSMTTDVFCLRVNIKKLWNAHVMRCTNNVIWELFLIWH